MLLQNYMNYFCYEVLRKFSKSSKKKLVYSQKYKVFEAQITRKTKKKYLTCVAHALILKEIFLIQRMPQLGGGSLCEFIFFLALKMSTKNLIMKSLWLRNFGRTHNFFFEGGNLGGLGCIKRGRKD